jgi:nitroreductase
MNVPPQDLYEAILARRSIRRYDSQPLDEHTLDQVREIISTVEPLIGANEFHVLLRSAPPGTDLAQDLGGYGRIVNPPHYLVPYLLGSEHVLADAGYRVEQISVRLAALGIGSCFIAALRREAEARARFGLPGGARIAAFLVFGRPTSALGGRATNWLLRLAPGADRKLSSDRLFFDGGFDNPALPPERIAPLIEAARHAPSAVHAQPWRFLWLDGQLHLLVTRRNLRYGTGPQAQYRFHDGGAAMANITLAMEALELEGQWTPPETLAPHLPKPPANLQLLATLTLGDKV